MGVPADVGTKALVSGVPCGTQVRLQAAACARFVRYGFVR